MIISVCRLDSFLVLFKWLELLINIETRDNEASILICLHKTLVDELFHQVCRCISSLFVCFHHLDFLLEHIVVSKFGRNLLLFQDVDLFLICNLLLRSSPFASFLKEIG